jgi:hypothetical protein
MSRRMSREGCIGLHRLEGGNELAIKRAKSAKNAAARRAFPCLNGVLS